MPSGDQAGFVPRPGSPAPEPSAFITKVWRLHARTLKKAIRAPSGDQAGLPLPPQKLACPASNAWLVPSAFIDQTWPPTPAMNLVNTILLPSGDQAGSDSPPGLLVMFVWPVPSTFITKTS